MTDYDLRSLAPFAIQDQGRRPLCAPFAVSAVHEAARARDGLPHQELAPEPIWSYNVSRGKAGFNGMALWDAEDAVESDGQPPLSDWPYNPTLAFRTEAAPGLAGVPPWMTRQVEQRASAMDGVEADLEAGLAVGSAVAVVIDTSKELFLPSPDGFVEEPANGFFGRLHAVGCFGMRETAERGRLLLIRNSWGTAWGLDGWGFVPMSYLRQWQLWL